VITPTRIISAITILSLAFPQIIYLFPYFTIVAGCSLFDMPVHKGAVALSYYGSMPAIGCLFYLFGKQRSTSSSTFPRTRRRPYLSEYLGLLLIVLWYLSMMQSIFLTHMESNRIEVAVPRLETPVTSVGLWFSSIVFGYALSAILGNIFLGNEKRGT